MGFIDAAADLLVQGACPGCARPGSGVCAGCARWIGAGVIGERFRAVLDMPLWSAGEYADPLTRIISQAKDHHRHDALPLLAQRLALAVAGLADALGLAGPGLLVPVPSAPAAVRERGLDFTSTLANTAARHLARAGLTTRAEPALRQLRAVQDPGGLVAAERQRNLTGSLGAVRPRSARWLVVVDDVVTTGASLQESVRALTAVGIPPVGLATVAATTLRTGGNQQNLALLLPNWGSSG
ncbi:MAG: ComF family protein [Propionibacteriaceae bacterium]|nr:ComF family protein [Propionibacteriaceae bacterium]